MNKNISRDITRRPNKTFKGRRIISTTNPTKDMNHYPVFVRDFDLRMLTVGPINAESAREAIEILRKLIRQHNESLHDPKIIDI